MDTSEQLAELGLKYKQLLEKANKKQAKYYAENAEERRAYAKQYYTDRKEIVLAKARERYQRKKAMKDTTE